MTHRQAKKIHFRWVRLHSGRLPWKKPTLEATLDYWLHARHLPNGVSSHAW